MQVFPQPPRTQEASIRPLRTCYEAQVCHRISNCSQRKRDNQPTVSKGPWRWLSIPIGMRSDRNGSVLLNMAANMPLTMLNLMIYLASSALSSMSTHLEYTCRYEDALKQTLMLGGDTDTNAAIVGGMLGALWGATAVPAHISGAVLSPASGQKGNHGYQKPIQFLQGDRLMPTAEALLSMAEGFQEMRRLHERRQPGSAESSLKRAYTPQRRSWGDSVKSWFHL